MKYKNCRVWLSVAVAQKVYIIGSDEQGCTHGCSDVYSHLTCDVPYSFEG